MQLAQAWDHAYAQLHHQFTALNNRPSQSPPICPPYKPISALRQQNRAHSTDQLVRLLDEYRPLSLMVDWQHLRSAAHSTVKKYKQSVYCGGFAEGKRTGPGVMLYCNGRVYEGQWLDNYKHGRGYERFHTGAVYVGDYSKGKPEGHGTYTWDNGETYEGQWLDGMKNGSGIWRGPSGDSYIGEWKNGLANGYGVHTWTNGDRYQGQFKDCLKHGEGVEKFANGDSYKGNYVMGKPEGFGEYYWSMGSFFKGYFVCGLRSGKGVWRRGPGNTDKYQGEYKEDKKQGEGIFTWQNGNVYRGNFSNDLKHGYGEMYYQDGRVYRGQWINNEPVGIISQFGQPEGNWFISNEQQIARSEIKLSHSRARQKMTQKVVEEDMECEVLHVRPEPSRDSCSPDQARFRAREVSSKKSFRDASEYHRSSCLRAQPEPQKKFSRKYSLAPRSPQPKFKKGSSDPRMMSSSFYLYKIHSHSPALGESHVRPQPRQVKTSGGMRQRHISEDIRHVARSKISPQRI